VTLERTTLLMALLGITLASSVWAAPDSRGADIFTVNSLADPGDDGCNVAECTLREAILAASAIAGEKVIEFQPGLAGTILLSSELLINFNGLTIEGPGPDVIQVSGNNASRVFLLNGSDVVIRGLTIRDGNTGTDNGAGFRILGPGSPTLENLRITNNTNIGQGAGIWLFFSPATLRHLEISDNTGALAALLINGSEGHDVLVENVTISGNVANQQASGLQVLSNAGQTVTLRYLTVANNSGSSLGASISGSAGVVAVEASLFANNAGRDLAFSNAEGSVNNSLIANSATSIPGQNNLVNVAPALGALQFIEGSVTRVHPLGLGPGVEHVDDAIGNAGCGTLVTEDQIGNSRPINLSCDVGAFELPEGVDILFEDRFEQ